VNACNLTPHKRYVNATASNRVNSSLGPHDDFRRRRPERTFRSTIMQRTAFLASFLAVFMTVDSFFWDGHSTHYLLAQAHDAASALDRQIVYWTRALSFRHSS
jgi:hypothetical protein